MLRKLTPIFIIGLVIFLSCRENFNHRYEYLQLISEIHKIECEHLKSAGVSVTDTSVYKFRGEAFQFIMKNTDRRVLAHYEDLCSKVASIVDFLNEGQKNEYELDVKKEYSKSCD